MTCGHSRCRSSRVSEGAQRGTPEYQEWPRRPRCEICERQSAPCRWMASLICRNWGMMVSSQLFTSPQSLTEVGWMLDEPNIITTPQPPFAFSSW